MALFLLRDTDAYGDVGVPGWLGGFPRATILGYTGGWPCYEAGLVNDKKASHRRPRAFFKARGVRYLFPPNASAASGAGSGGANPRLVCSACELGGVGVTLGLGDVLRQNSQDLSPAAQPAIQGGGVPLSF